jgi:hypothetical protein
MKRFSFFLLAILVLGGAIAFVQPAAAREDVKQWGCEVGGYDSDDGTRVDPDHDGGPGC